MRLERTRLLVLFAGVVGLIGALTLLFYLNMAGRGLEPDTGEALGRDFIAFYSAGHMAARGDAVQAYNVTLMAAEQAKIAPVVAWARPWFYPPPMLLAVRPLGLFSDYVWAYTIWALGGLAAFGLMLWRACPQRWVLLSVLAPAVAYVTIMGQAGLWMTALFTGACLALSRQRQGLAGVLIGLMIIKPTFGVLIPLVLLAGRYWRAFFAAAGTVVAIIALSLAVDGSAAWQGFLSISPLVKAYMTTGLVLSGGVINSLYVLVNVYGLLRTLGWTDSHALILQAVAGLFVATSLIWVWWRQRASDPAIAMLLAGTCCATPYMLTYDLVLLIAAAVFLLRASTHRLMDVLILILALTAGSLMVEVANYKVQLAVLAPIFIFMTALHRALQGSQPHPVNFSR